ncbi:cytochrome c oxidase subunit II transmembrane domain-containing protein [Microcoleus sp. A2-C5]|uniref:cytochrome c oxidase subunit II n=1 Tax=unclassified Microcoleus TaxID=2642155 RepID=UPI002FD25B7E
MKIFNSLLLAIAIALDMIASHWVGQQAYSWMPSQGTAEAKQVDNLFSFLVSIGTFIFIGIAAIILYSILTSRAPKGDFSHGHPARGNWKIEILWVVVPVLLVTWIAAQSYMIYQKINIQGLTPIAHLHMALEEPVYAASKPTENNNNPKPVAENIEVIAKQWSWSFRYPRQNVTSTELHLPVNQNVRLTLQSLDVIHGFYVPEFRIKQDIIPNRSINFVFAPIREGKYRLRDSQFSGTYFALMDADVYVESPAAYDRWLTKAATQSPTAASNQAVSEHTKQVQNARGSFWPTVKPAAPPVVNHPN